MVYAGRIENGSGADTAIAGFSQARSGETDIRDVKVVESKACFVVSNLLFVGRFAPRLSHRIYAHKIHRVFNVLVLMQNF
jgi:hypothetical protein